MYEACLYFLFFLKLADKPYWLSLSLVYNKDMSEIFHYQPLATPNVPKQDFRQFHN